MGFVGSDLWKVRQKWGSGPLVWPGVTALVFDETESLLWLGKRNDNNLWSVLGGYFELGDSADMCLRREVLEELGVQVLSAEMMAVFTDPKRTYITYPNGHEVQSPSYFYKVCVNKSEVVGDDEHTDFGWYDLDTATEMMRGGFGYSSAILECYQIWKNDKKFQIL